MPQLESIDDYIVLHHAMIHSLAVALIGAGALDPTDIADACRVTAGYMQRDCVSAELLDFAETIEWPAEALKRGLEPSWTPQVIEGGKAGDPPPEDR